MAHYDGLVGDGSPPPPGLSCSNALIARCHYSRCDGIQRPVLWPDGNRNNLLINVQPATAAATVNATPPDRQSVQDDWLIILPFKNCVDLATGSTVNLNWFSLSTLSQPDLIFNYLRGWLIIAGRAGESWNNVKLDGSDYQMNDWLIGGWGGWLVCYTISSVDFPQFVFQKLSYLTRLLLLGWH